MTTLPLLPATVIGSWSFPGWYAKFCDDAARQPDLFGADDRDEAVRDAVRLAVDDQLQAGADLISDGEMQRVDQSIGGIAGDHVDLLIDEGAIDQAEVHYAGLRREM